MLTRIRIVLTALIAMAVFVLSQRAANACTLTSDELSAVKVIISHNAPQSFVDGWVTHYCEINHLRELAAK